MRYVGSMLAKHLLDTKANRVFASALFHVVAPVFGSSL